MNTQLKAMIHKAEKAGACKKALEKIKQYNTLDEVLNDKNASSWCYWYADYVLRKKRFKLGEKAISKNPKYSLWYAEDIVNGRFRLGEKAISKYPDLSYYYSRNALKWRRFKLGEKAIGQCAHYSLDYVKLILNDRFKAGEDVMRRAGYWQFYVDYLKYKGIEIK